MPSTVILEPRNDCPEMQDALQARIHDPLWLLARQWQMGEFKGDDAGSPAAAQLIVRNAPISRFLPGPLPTDPTLAAEHTQNYSPLTLPLETLVEREPIRRPGQNNLRLAAETGQHFLRILVAQKSGTHRPLFRTAFPLRRPNAAERLALDDDTLHFLDVVGQRAVDGLKLYRKLTELRQGSGLAALFNQALFNSIPEGDRAGVVQAMNSWLGWFDGLFSESTENGAWLRDRLEYSFSVSGQTVAGETVLRAPEYLEGHLDWYSFVVHPTAKLGAIGQVPSSTFCFLPTPVTFRGMPAPRLWEFEDARVNFGRVEANPQDVARLLLVEFGLAYGNDWFVIPIELDAGSLCRIGALVVANTFGERMLISSSAEVDGADSSWRMFALSLDRSTNGEPGADAIAKSQDLFFLPPVLGMNLEGTTLEEVLLVRDEMANMAWAVERIVESPSNHPLDRFEAYQQMQRRRESAAAAEPEAAPNGELTYRLGTTVPDYWIPLLPVQVGSTLRLKRGSLPRLETGEVEGTFDPQGLILDPGHDLVLPDEEVPREGARVTRSYQYARWVDGSMHLWVGRRKEVARGEGSSGLRFDTIERS
jgi:hypothetical protein